MGIVILVLLFIVLAIGLFPLLKWVFPKKARVVVMLALLAVLTVSIALNRVFFKKMELVQSKVYPNLYLIKNPVEDRNVVNNAVKEMVLQKIDDQEKRINETSKDSETFALRFYEYNKGDWGESGTAYFLEHQERKDGMTAELLEYYPEYRIAEYNQQPCKESSGNFGKLDYYNDRKRFKTDTLLNSCYK